MEERSVPSAPQPAETWRRRRGGRRPPPRSGAHPGSLPQDRLRSRWEASGSSPDRRSSPSPVGSVWEEVTLNPRTSSLEEILPLSGKLQAPWIPRQDGGLPRSPPTVPAREPQRSWRSSSEQRRSQEPPRPSAGSRVSEVPNPAQTSTDHWFSWFLDGSPGCSQPAAPPVQSPTWVQAVDNPPFQSGCRATANVTPSTSVCGLKHGTEEEEEAAAGAWRGSSLLWVPRCWGSAGSAGSQTGSERISWCSALISSNL